MCIILCVVSNSSGKVNEHGVGFSACVLFNTPGPLLHSGPPGPGPLANPGGHYSTMDGKATGSYSDQLANYYNIIWQVKLRLGQIGLTELNQIFDLIIKRPWPNSLGNYSNEPASL